MSVRSACGKGFRSYLAEQHKVTMDKALGKGVVVGGICTAILYGLDRAFDFKLSAYWYVSSFSLLTAASAGTGILFLNSEDLEHKAAFDSICSKYEEKDEGGE